MFFLPVQMKWGGYHFQVLVSLAELSLIARLLPTRPNLAKLSDLKIILVS